MKQRRLRNQFNIEMGGETREKERFEHVTMLRVIYKIHLSRENLKEQTF